MWRHRLWKLACYLVPLPSSRYVRTYFQLIASADHQATVRVLQSILLCIAVMCLGQYVFVPVDGSDQQHHRWLQVLTFDTFGYNRFLAIFRLILSIVAMGMAYFHQLFYLDMVGNPVGDVLATTLFDPRRRVHLGGRTITLERLVVQLVWSFQPGSVCSDFYSLFAYVQLAMALARLDFVGCNSATLVTIIMFNVCGFLFLSFNCLSLAISCLAMWVVMATAVVLSARHRTTNLLLRPAKWAAPPRRRLLRFVHENVLSLLFVLSSNRIFGKMMATTLAMMMPMNGSMLVIALTNTQMNVYTRSALVLIGTSALVMLQVIHYLVAQFSARLHSPYGRVMSVFLRHSPRWTLKERLRIAHNIHAFHVQRKYGLTYGDSNLNITRMSFVKFLFFYTEVIFYLVALVH